MADDIIKVIILALVEGVTEFLPISSTGHLIVGKSLLGLNGMGAVFEIFIQFGAVLAVVFYYRKTLYGHKAGLSLSPEVRRFWALVMLSCLPAAVIGFLAGERIGQLLFTPQVVAMSLIAGGVVFLVVERLPIFQPRERDPGSITEITMRQALTVGLVQVLALIPGVSRSGSSIIGGILSGLDRRQATEYSFFLAIPLLGGATLYRLATVIHTLGYRELFLLLLGAALSAVFAWLSIEWLLRFVSNNSFVVFGYYRIFCRLADPCGSFFWTDCLTILIPAELDRYSKYCPILVCPLFRLYL